MSLTGIAVNAVGVVAGGCIALRQKLLESEAEQQQLINAEYAGLTSSIAAIKGAVDDRQQWLSLRGLLPPDWEQEQAALNQPTGGGAIVSSPPKLLGPAPLAPNVSDRWKPTESARERVAQRVEERLAVAYEAAQAEAARVRAAHPAMLALQAPQQPPQLTTGEELPWGLSEQPHFTPDLSNGRPLDYHYPNEHPGAWGLSAAPHFIPDVAGRSGMSPARPPHGSWPAQEGEYAAMAKLQAVAARGGGGAGGDVRSNSSDAIEMEAALREQAMFEAARAVMGGGSDDPRGFSIGGSSYGGYASQTASMTDGQERALSILSALSALGTDESPEAMAAGKMLQAGASPEEAVIALTRAGTHPPPALVAVAERAKSDTAAYRGKSANFGVPAAAYDKRAASSILTTGNYGQSGFPGAMPTGMAPTSAAPLAAAPAHSGSAMLAAMLRDPSSPPKIPPAAAPGMADFGHGPGFGKRSASDNLHKHKKSSDPVRAMTAAASFAASGQAGRPFAPGGALPPTLEENSSEYEYYAAPATAEEIAGKLQHPAEVQHLINLAREADEARLQLEAATAAEEVAHQAVAMAEEGMKDAKDAKAAVGDKLENVHKLEGEVTAARDTEQGLKRMVAQQEQAVEDAQGRVDGLTKKGKMFSKNSKEKTEAMKVVEGESTKLATAKERLDAAVTKLQSLLRQVDTLSVLTDEESTKAGTMEKQAESDLAAAREQLAQVEARRRDAEAAAADAAAAAERERISLLGTGNLSSESIDAISASFHSSTKTDERRPSLAGVAGVAGFVGGLRRSSQSRNPSSNPSFAGGATTTANLAAASMLLATATAQAPSSVLAAAGMPAVAPAMAPAALAPAMAPAMAPTVAPVQPAQSWGPAAAMQPALSQQPALSAPPNPPSPPIVLPTAQPMQAGSGGLGVAGAGGGVPAAAAVVKKPPPPPVQPPPPQQQQLAEDDEYEYIEEEEIGLSEEEYEEEWVEGEEELLEGDEDLYEEVYEDEDGNEIVR